MSGERLLTLALVAAACAHEPRPPECARLSREQCLWHLAQRPDRHGSAGTRAPRDGATPAGQDSDDGWTRMDRLLQEAVGWLADGLGGEVLSREARRWCIGEPTVQDKGQGPSWVCHLEDPPKIGDREFTLEGNAAGVLAVRAGDLSGEQSRQVVALALHRWRAWCLESRFSAVEGSPDEEFHRCALPGGPLLVVGRFPQDPEADLWQVSLTVMGAA